MLDKNDRTKGTMYNAVLGGAVFVVSIHSRKEEDGELREGLTGNNFLCRALKRAPRKAPPTLTMMTKGSCRNHSCVLSGVTPSPGDSTPFLHLRM